MTPTEDVRVKAMALKNTLDRLYLWRTRGGRISPEDLTWMELKVEDLATHPALANERMFR